MNETTLNAVLLTIGIVTVVYALLARTILLGAFVLLALFTVWLLYRLLTAVERLADEVARLRAATAAGGRADDHRTTDLDRDGETRPATEERDPDGERDPDELFE